MGFSLVSSSWSSSSRVFTCGHPVQAELLEISSQRVHQASLVSIEWLESLGFCLAFGLFWMM